MCAYLVDKDYIGMHELPLKTFKTSFVALSLDFCRLKPPSKTEALPSRMVSIMTKRKAPIIKHSHLCNPPTAAPKISPFKRAFAVIKAAMQRIVHRRKDGMEPREFAAPEEDTYWPSDTEESSFISQMEEDVQL